MTQVTGEPPRGPDLCILHRGQGGALESHCLGSSPDLIVQWLCGLEHVTQPL